MAKENDNPEDEEIQQEEETEQELEDEKDKRIKELEHDLAVCKADSYNYRQRVIKERNETRKRSQEEVITASIRHIWMTVRTFLQALRWFRDSS